MCWVSRLLRLMHFLDQFYVRACAGTQHTQCSLHAFDAASFIQSLIARTNILKCFIFGCCFVWQPHQNSIFTIFGSTDTHFRPVRQFQMWIHSFSNLIGHSALYTITHSQWQSFGQNLCVCNRKSGWLYGNHSHYLSSEPSLGLSKPLQPKFIRIESRSSRW